MAGVDTFLKITASVVGLNAVKDLTNEIKKISTASENTKRSLTLMSNAVGNFIKIYAANQLRKMVDDVINLGDELHNLSQRTGVSVEDLSRFKTAAEQAGVGLEGLAKAFKTLNVNKSSALGDSQGASATLFQSLGIDPGGSTSKTILDIADKFSKMEDGAKKTAYANKLLGKSGDELIPFFNQGREALEKFTAIMDDNFAAAASHLNDDLIVMQANFTKLEVDALTPIIPAITSILEGFHTLFKDIDDNKENLNGTVGAFQLLAEAMRGIAVSFATIKHFGSQTVNAVATGTAVLQNQFMRGSGISTSDILGVGGARIDKTNQQARAAVSQIMSGSLIESFIAKQLGVTLPKAAATKPLHSNVPQPDAGAVSKQEALALKEYIVKQNELNKTLAQEADYLGKTTVEIDKMKAARAIDAEVAEKSRNMTAAGAEKFKAAGEAIKTMRLELIQLNYEQSRTFEAGAVRAFTKYREEVTDASQMSEKLFTDAFQGAEDALVAFTTTGKLNFKSLAQSIIADIARIQIRKSIISPLLDLFSGLMPNGGLFQSTGGIPTGGFAGATGVPFAFANGGIMGNLGSMPLKRYSTGGIANSPQLAMFGEGRMKEAYVPLPDGRSIPVTMKGGAGANITNYIPVSANGTTTTSSTGDKKEQLELGRIIAASVKTAIMNEQRPGGILASTAQR